MSEGFTATRSSSCIFANERGQQWLLIEHDIATGGRVADILNVRVLALISE